MGKVYELALQAYNLAQTSKLPYSTAIDCVVGSDTITKLAVVKTLEAIIVEILEAKLILMTGGKAQC